MKLRDALRGIVLLGIDSAPLIYVVEQHPVYLDRMIFILRYLTSGAIAGMSSVLTITEVLSQPLRTENLDLVQEYEDILHNSVGFEVVPLTAKIARKAADLRAKYNLKTPDAIQVATCIEAGCDAFLTNDLGIKRVQELRVLILDELELEPPRTESSTE